MLAYAIGDYSLNKTKVVFSMIFVGGFTTVTIASVVLAGYLAKTITTSGN